MQGSEIRDLYSFDRIKITDQGFDGEDGKFIFTASPDERFTPLCHACGGSDQTLHTSDSRPLRDLPVDPLLRWII